MAEKGRLLTGARARFSINGVKVGYARNVAITEEIQMEPVEVLDNIEVEENVPVAYRITQFNAGLFRVIGETMKSQNWFPKAGANTAEHLLNILNTGDLNATIEDTKTGSIFAIVEQVKVQSKNLSIDARGIIGEDVNFVAIRMKDESEI